MNRLSLVLTYISGQVLIFWQEGQKVYKLILQFWDYIYNEIDDEIIVQCPDLDALSIKFFIAKTKEGIQ